MFSTQSTYCSQNLKALVMYYEKPTLLPIAAYINSLFLAAFTSGAERSEANDCPYACLLEGLLYLSTQSPAETTFQKAHGDNLQKGGLPYAVRVENGYLVSSWN